MCKENMDNRNMCYRTLSSGNCCIFPSPSAAPYCSFPGERPLGCDILADRALSCVPIARDGLSFVLFLQIGTLWECYEVAMGVLSCNMQYWAPTFHAQAPLTSPCPQSNHTITINLTLTFAASCFGHASHVNWAEQDPPNFVHGYFCHIIALHFGPQHSL